MRKYCRSKSNARFSSRCDDCKGVATKEMYTNTRRASEWRVPARARTERASPTMEVARRTIHLTYYTLMCVALVGAVPALLYMRLRTPPAFLPAAAAAAAAA